MVRGHRPQVLEQAVGGPTVYYTEERFRGALAFAVSTRAVQDGFQRHAAALKRHAESLV
jgi:hypothetical protein